MISSQASPGRVFIHWPTSPLPQRVLPRDLAVRFVLTKAIRRSTEQVWIRPVLEPWNEFSFTDGNQPKLGKPIALKQAVRRSRGVFESLAVLPLIRRWLRQPSLNYGIAVQSEIGNPRMFYRDNLPRLELRIEIRKNKKQSKKR